jgi:hypothetical protein
MSTDHDVDFQTQRCRHCGRGLLAIQYEECVQRAPNAAPRARRSSGRVMEATVPQRALDFINRGWKPTI